MNDDLISRQAAIDVLEERLQANGYSNVALVSELNRSIGYLMRLPSAQPEQKKGKWVEKHHAYSDEESVIEEWQSCRCSECGRYDTRPYMYYFSEPNYCSYCGADMRGKKNDRRRMEENERR